VNEEINKQSKPSFSVESAPFYSSQRIAPLAGGAKGFVAQA
jgi:hypothetical protein